MVVGTRNLYVGYLDPLGHTKPLDRCGTAATRFENLFAQLWVTMRSGSNA